jgi:hypothetical protein
LSKDYSCKGKEKLIKQITKVKICKKQVNNKAVNKHWIAAFLEKINS